MKNLFIYYLVILVPFAAFPLLLKTGHGTLAVACFLFYAFIYRSLTDGYRLIRKGVLKKGELWKMFIPFWIRSRYFKELYLE